jgi:hypothetical protein
LFKGANGLPPAPPEPFETPVGFTWLPLVVKRGGGAPPVLALSEDIQEFELPIAMSPPPALEEFFGGGGAGTAATTPSGAGGSQQQQTMENSSGIKYVDNGKPLFRFRARLVSTV